MKQERKQKERKSDRMSERYPQLRVNIANLCSNLQHVVDLAEPYGIKITAVIKGFNSLVPCCPSLMKTGCLNLGASRIEHLKAIKEFDVSIPTELVRIPMLSEAADVIRYADTSLVSECATIRRLSECAAAAGKVHKVIIMKDIGDLREGFIDEDELKHACALAESLPGIFLYGIGANFGCYGSVCPTEKNLSELAESAFAVEKIIGRTLDIVSGGETSSLPVMLRGEMPEKINNLRTGISLITEARYAWDEDFPDRKVPFILRAEIVELKNKPTMPIGEQTAASMNEVRNYVDLGIRKRAIVALGHQDLGNIQTNLIPVDPKIRIWGASSDHTMLDLEDCDKAYKIGDTVDFYVNYPGCLFSSMSPTVKKVFTE